jgi:hypothetical protein
VPDRIPGAVPASEVAYQDYLAAQARAAAALEQYHASEAAGPYAEISMEEAGYHGQQMDWEADRAWDKYNDARADEAYPETSADGQAALDKLDAELGPDPVAELDNELDLGM